MSPPLPQQSRLWLGLVALFLVGQAATKTLFEQPWRPVRLGDSGRYIDAATRFPRLGDEEPGYASYIAVMWIGDQLGSSTWFALGVQTVAVIVAAAALWDTARRFGSEIAGWIAAAFYLLNPLIAQWSGAILTEALFYASVIGAGWALSRRFDHGEGRIWPIVALAFFACFTRPNGIVFFAVVVALVGWLGLRSRVWRTIWVGAVAVVVGALSLTLPFLSSGGGGEANAFGPRTWAGEVFWGDDDWRLTMPQPSQEELSNAALIRYVVEHPIDMARLAGARAGWELAQVRPWYSTPLNIFAATSTAGLFLMGLSGFVLLRTTAFTKLAALTTLASLGLIGLTWAIHEGRFGWWFYVLWIVWAAVAVEWIGRRLVGVVSG